MNGSPAEGRIVINLIEKKDDAKGFRRVCERGLGRYDRIRILSSECLHTCLTSVSLGQTSLRGYFYSADPYSASEDKPGGSRVAMIELERLLPSCLKIKSRCRLNVEGGARGYATVSPYAPAPS